MLTVRMRQFFGKLIIAIHRMVAMDLLQFLAIYVFCLMGFSLAVASAAAMHPHLLRCLRARRWG